MREPYFSVIPDGVPSTGIRMDLARGFSPRRFAWLLAAHVEAIVATLILLDTLDTRIDPEQKALVIVGTIGPQILGFGYFALRSMRKGPTRAWCAAAWRAAGWLYLVVLLGVLTLFLLQVREPELRFAAYLFLLGACTATYPCVRELSLLWPGRCGRCRRRQVFPISDKAEALQTSERVLGECMACGEPHRRGYRRRWRVLSRVRTTAANPRSVSDRQRGGAVTRSR